MSENQVFCDLTNKDGNAYAIMARVSTALKQAKVPPDEIQQYQSESMLGDYQNLLQVAMRYLEKHNIDYE